MVLNRLIALTLIGPCLANSAIAGATEGEHLPEMAAQSECLAPEASTPCAHATGVWRRLRNGFHLADIEHPAIAIETARLAKSPKAFVARAERAAPFLRYVADRVDARGLPSDIVLLPFIESGYRPVAVSGKSAKGLWQLMPATGRRFGLEETWWFDPRLDLEASTRAALDYLEFLESRFAGDWLLALAAYNAGEGRVSAAIAKNRGSGRPTDFWNLDLPKETRAYVPRLLAMVRAIGQPGEFGLALPHVADVPFLERVSVGGALDLHIAAELALTNVETIVALNPGLKRSMTSPTGANALVLPAGAGRHLRMTLARVSRDEDPRYRKLTYTVRSGDSLWAIAKHFGVPVRSLAGWNNLILDEVIRPGHRLEIWT